MECSYCGLINPPEARTCDCGFDLSSRTIPIERKFLDRSRSMECSYCGLVNPPGSLACDCGFDFESGTISIERHLREQTSRRSTAALYLSMDGRLNRRDYWLYYFLPALVASTIVGALLSTLVASLIGLSIFWCYVIVGTYVSVVVHVKRWHDRDKSGWWSLLLFIPLVGEIWTLIECGFLAGTPGPNRYGPSPTAHT